MVAAARAGTTRPLSQVFDDFAEFALAEASEQEVARAVLATAMARLKRAFGQRVATQILLAATQAMHRQTPSIKPEGRG